MFNNKIIPIFLLVLILQGCKDVEVIVEGNGRVYDVVGEGNINCGSGAGEGKCKNSYGNGVDSVTFKAEPDSGYRLKTWGNSCKGDVCSSTFLEGIPELLNVAFEKVPTEISYTYNASGQRVSKTVEGEITFFIYQLDGSLLAELDVNGNTVVDYIYLEGKPVAQVRPQSSGTDDTAYIHADHIGAPKAATNQSGEVIWQIKTTPFGEVYSETGALVQNQRFPGQYADQESGYAYNYFRDYDSSLGRYIQSDPIGLEGGLNTYGYVGGSPVNYSDPYGLFKVCRRPLSFAGDYMSGPSESNRGIYHEHGFYEDGTGDNTGFTDYGEFDDRENVDKYQECDDKKYDDEKMRKAQENIKNDWNRNYDYEGNGGWKSDYDFLNNNCQHYTDALIIEYNGL